MGRPLFVFAALSLCLLAAVPAAAGELQRHWAFGWDPVESGRGLTLRYRFSPVWDLGVSAGPNDYRNDTASRNWDDDAIVVEDGYLTTDDARREQGWVRLAGAGRFWHEDRVAVSAVCGVTYRWSAEEQRNRLYQQYLNEDWDYRNSRNHDDIRIWTVAVGLRPSVVITSRLQVEFEAGVRFERITTDNVFDAWWDSYPPTVHDEETRHERSLTTYGGFELSELKFIFWF